MNGVELQAALCHHIGGDGRVDTAADQHGGESRRTHRHTALTADGLTADISAEVTHLYRDSDLGILDVDLEVRAGFEELAAYLRRDLGTFVGKALVGTLALNLEGLSVLEIGRAVCGGFRKDIVEILLTHAGAGEGHDAEHLADTLAYFIEVGILRERIDIDGGLGDLDLEFTESPESVFDIFEEHILEGAAVESL